MDLKIIFKVINIIVKIILSFSYLFKFYLVIFVTLISITFMLLIALIHKYFIHQIQKLYLFIRYNLTERSKISDFFLSHIVLCMLTIQILFHLVYKK